MAGSLKRSASDAFGSDSISPRDCNRSLFESGRFSDVTVECNGWIFKAHKSILCSQSRFFEVALDGGHKESVESLIKFPEEEPVTVWRALQYLYTDDYDLVDEGYGSKAQSTDSTKREASPCPSQTKPVAKTPCSKLENNFYVYRFACMYDLGRLQSKAASVASSLRSDSKMSEVAQTIKAIKQWGFESDCNYLQDHVEEYLQRMHDGPLCPSRLKPEDLIHDPFFAAAVLSQALDDLWRTKVGGLVFSKANFAANIGATAPLPSKRKGKGGKAQKKVKPTVPLPKCSYHITGCSEPAITYSVHDEIFQFLCDRHLEAQRLITGKSL